MIKRAAVLILSLGVIASVFTGCKSGSDASDEIKLPIYGWESITYEVATAEYMDITETESMGATIGYPYADYLHYPADAQVVSYSAVKGRSITEGEVLAELDSSDLDYEINNQQTIVDTAYASSLGGGEAARLQYEIEKYTLDMLIAEKERYTIKAPYDGIVTYVNRASAGDEITAGDICCLVSPHDNVQIYIDGGDANKFRFGQDVVVKIDGEEYAATVVMAPDTIPATADGKAARRAVFALEEGVMDTLIKENEMAIAAGWATVYLTTEKKNVLAVPDSAVKTVGSTSSVTLLSGEERFRLNVSIGKSLGGYTEILNGISEGDVVIADGSGTFVSANTENEQNNDFGGWNGEWNGEWNQ